MNKVTKKICLSCFRIEVKEFFILTISNLTACRQTNVFDSLMRVVYCTNLQITEIFKT